MPSTRRIIVAQVKLKVLKTVYFSEHISCTVLQTFSYEFPVGERSAFFKQLFSNT
jgi:hypothetical protein